jgi:acyl carrier protein
MPFIPSIPTDPFLESITDAFDFRVSSLDLSTRFRHLKEWDSMVSVLIAAASYANYNVQVSGEDLVSCETLGDLKQLIESRLPPIS